jgi:outer membrane protein TolC
MNNKMLYSTITAFFVRIVVTLLIFAVTSYGTDLTLDQALEKVISHSSRAAAVRGDLQVAEQQFFAEKINFWVPEVSLNGQVPAYSEDKSLQFFSGANQRFLDKKTDFTMSSNLQLKQSLFTGGELFARANLRRNKSNYPRYDGDTRLGVLEEINRQRFLDFTFEQPLLQPSVTRNDLSNRRDDMEIAKISYREQMVALKKEVVETYFSVLKLGVQRELQDAKWESTGEKARIDSLKHSDGILAEDEWLKSSSAYLDAELSRYDIDNQAATKRRDLAMLLDADPLEMLTVATPAVPSHLSDEQKTVMRGGWEQSAAIVKAQYTYEKQKRAAEFTSKGHGLSGKLSANYAMGRDELQRDTATTPNPTTSWGVVLSFSFPIWDGGAGSAASRAADLSAEKSRLEVVKAERAAKADLENLLNGLDVSYRKIEVLNKQIELSRHRLDIADLRFKNGEISKIIFLEAKSALLESQTKYLDELKNYYTLRLTLEGSLLM